MMKRRHETVDKEVLLCKAYDVMPLRSVIMETCLYRLRFVQVFSCTDFFAYGIHVSLLNAWFRRDFYVIVRKKYQKGIWHPGCAGY